MDAILALRLLAELHRNFNIQLDVATVAYIDIKSAFDSVDRVALWKALRGSGMPPFLLQLIRDLHTGTTARVRTPQGMSDVFYTTSGVRHKSSRNRTCSNVLMSVVDKPDCAPQASSS